MWIFFSNGKKNRDGVTPKDALRWSAGTGTHGTNFHSMGKMTAHLFSLSLVVPCLLSRNTLRTYFSVNSVKPPIKFSCNYEGIARIRPLSGDVLSEVCGSVKSTLLNATVSQYHPAMGDCAHPSEHHDAVGVVRWVFGLKELYDTSRGKSICAII